MTLDFNLFSSQQFAVQGDVSCDGVLDPECGGQASSSGMAQGAATHTVARQRQQRIGNGQRISLRHDEKLPGGMPDMGDM